VTDVEREHWARAMTTAGWLVVVGYLGIVVLQIDRARRTTEAAFEDGVWGQRIEQVSFVAIPQNIVVLFAAAIVTVGAVVVGRGTLADADVWLDRLVRVVAGTAIVAILIAVIRVLDVMIRDPQTGGDLPDIVSRLSGILIGIAVVRLCLAAERTRFTS